MFSSITTVSVLHNYHTISLFPKGKIISFGASSFLTSKMIFQIFINSHISIEANPLCV